MAIKSGSFGTRLERDSLSARRDKGNNFSAWLDEDSCEKVWLCGGA